jgi:hypothetical protein
MESEGKVYLIGRGNGKSIRSLDATMNRLQTTIIDEYVFAMAGIQLTDEQKHALYELGLVFDNIAEVMITAIKGPAMTLDGLPNALQDTFNKPKMDYTQKHTPWKKDKFYY